jgi:methyl-accepting chemotaxis protein
MAMSQWLMPLLTGLVLAYPVARLIAYPVVKLAKETKAMVDNELARQVYGGSQCETAQIRLAMRMSELQSNSIVARINDGAGQLNDIISTTHRLAQETSEGVAIQQSEIEQLATAMHEMTATVQEVAKNTSDAAEAAQRADKVVEDGKHDVMETVSSISQVAEDVKQATSVVEELQAKSENIGTVLDVIRGIADQTNLLALNAAIEAARAGEQGRGFAVVADEVRSLAKRTQESTQEIQEMIESMQEGTGKAVAAMETGSQRVSGSVEQAHKAGESLDEIASIVAVISDMAIQIASATEEQSSVSEEVNRNVINISDAAERNAANSQQTMETVEQLEVFASHLQTLVSQFKKTD